MNFITHHAAARRLAPDADPMFYVGNLLPDLLGISGAGRLRLAHLPDAGRSPLAEGIALHLKTDRQFHSSPLFKRICADVSELLRATPFHDPPHRLFFVAHLFVELALDAAVLRADNANPNLIEHLYMQFNGVELEPVTAETAILIGAVQPLIGLDGVLENFTRHRYLIHYQKSEGLADALTRIGRRAQVPNFTGEDDQARLGDVFTRFEPAADDFAREILALIAPGNADKLS